MTYVVMTGVAYEGFSPPVFAGTDESAAKVVFAQLRADSDEQFYDYIVMFVYDEQGKRTHEEMEYTK